MATKLETKSAYGIIERLDAFGQPLYWTGRFAAVDGKVWSTIPSEAVRIQRHHIPVRLLELDDQGWKNCRVVWLLDTN
jgi:hypothetical protein